MSIAVGSVLQFVLRSTYASTVTCLNRFYYQVSEFTETLASTLDAGQNFARGLWKKLGSPLRNLATAQLQYQQVDWNVYDLTTGLAGIGGVYTIPTTERAGLVAGQTLPPFATAVFRYVRPSTAFRHGYKRFSGVPEAMTDNGFISSTESAALNLRAALSEDIGYWTSDGAPVGVPLNAAFPVIVRKTLNGQPVLPQTAAEPAAVQFVAQLGTQNTRKYGRGA